MKIRNASLDIVCGVTSALPETGKPEVAFAGKSNVGKSSLINVLMNRKNLARTSASPGKTRTVNYYLVDFLPEKEADGNILPKEVYLVDLPGYGYAQVSQEVKASWGKMIERYLHSSAGLKTVFLLVDIRHSPSENDRMMYRWILDQGWSPVVLATKLDKIRKSQRQKQLRVIREGLQMEGRGKIIPFSAQTREGCEEIWTIIAEAMEDISEEAPGRTEEDQ